MDEQTSAEFKRLESIIEHNTGATRGLSEKVSDLSERVKMIEYHRENDEKKDAKIDKQIEDLTKLLLDFKGQFDTFNGILKGIKGVWAVIGVLVVATILGAAGMLWNFNSELSEVKTKVERLDK